MGSRSTSERDHTSQAVERFRTFLAGKRLRMTREREVVLDEIFASREHFDVEDLFARLGREDRHVSRATIYRTLDLLVESGLVNRARFATDTFQYEPRFGTSHHDHMVCTLCGRVIEFVSEEIERLQRKECLKHGFKIKSHRHVILGHCRGCQDKEDEEVG